MDSRPWRRPHLFETRWRHRYSPPVEIRYGSDDERARRTGEMRMGSGIMMRPPVTEVPRRAGWTTSMHFATFAKLAACVTTRCLG